MRSTTTRILAPVALVAAATLAFAAPASAKTVKATDTPAKTSRGLIAHLTGAQEVSDTGTVVGDPQAIGWATIKVKADGKVCYSLFTGGFSGTATGAHIHHQVAGKNGPAVIDLKLVWGGLGVGCTETDAETAAALIDHPDGYYVNVHTTAYPNGALRGQLH